MTDTPDGTAFMSKTAGPFRYMDFLDRKERALPEVMMQASRDWWMTKTLTLGE